MWVSYKFLSQRRWRFCECKNPGNLWYCFLLPIVRIPNACLFYSYGSELSFHLFCLGQNSLKWHLPVFCYTGCPRRKGPNFGRVFLRSNYTDITQNTYIQSSIFTEILAREKCGLLWCLRTLLFPWRHSLDLQRNNPVIAPLLQLHSYVIARCSSQRRTTLATEHIFGVYSGWKSVDNYDTVRVFS